MATAITTDPTEVELIFDQRDYRGEPGKVTIPLDGAVDSTDLIGFVDDYIALTNALITPTVKYTYGFTGYATAGKPSSSAQGLIAAIFAMEFQKANPLNAAKTIEKQVVLPAYLDAIMNAGVSPHIAVTTNTTLNNAIAFLETYLDYVAVSGVHYPGSWTFNPGSKFGTKLTVTDGF